MDGPGDHVYQFLKCGSLLSNRDLTYSVTELHLTGVVLTKLSSRKENQQAHDIKIVLTIVQSVFFDA